MTRAATLSRHTIYMSATSCDISRGGTFALVRFLSWRNRIVELSYRADRQGD